MNKFFVHRIYKTLADGIDKGYRAGIRSIVAENHKKFTVRKFAKSKIFDVNYTGTDRKAIENFKINAFKVAGVGSWELEEELKKLGIEVLENKIPDFNSFEIAARKKMMEYGIGLGDQPPSGWLKQNLDMAIKNSIAGARWNRVNDPALEGLYTHWVYHTQMDSAVRPAHRLLEGRVFRLDDPSAAKLIPPNDWGCRCYEEYITAHEAGQYE